MGFMRIDDLRVDTKFQNCLPVPGEKEFRGLVEDIRARGILVDLLVTHDGLLLDGHRRLLAAKAAGLSRVPVKKLNVNGESDWEYATAIVINLYRRHLNEAQRAAIGSSLLRLERLKARERQIKGGRKGGKIAGRGRGKQALGNVGPEPIKDFDRATERVANAVGISRKTFERVETVKRQDPEIANQMLAGRISITAAYNKVKNGEVKECTSMETHAESVTGLIQDLSTVKEKYRTVYMGPTWSIRGMPSAGSKGQVTVTEYDLLKLPLNEVAHPDGCYFWIWAPWPVIRRGIPYRLFNNWGFEWVGELIWDKQTWGLGKWVRNRTELLILAIKGAPPPFHGVDPLIQIKNNAHGERPENFYILIEELCPGPRIELFTYTPRPSWDRWGGIE